MRCGVPRWPCAPYDVLRPLAPRSRRPVLPARPRRHALAGGRHPRRAGHDRGSRPRPADAEIELEAWGSGADWMLDHAPAMLGADDDVSAFQPRDDARPGGLGPQPALAGDQDRPGARGAGRVLPRAEGHRPGGLDRLAAPAAPLRRGRSRARAQRAAMKMMPSAAGADRGSPRGSGCAATSTARARGRSSGRPGSPTRCSARSTSRRPRPRRRCGRCPASVSGPPPRSASVPTGTPTPSASATTTSPPTSAGP